MPSQRRTEAPAFFRRDQKTSLNTGLGDPLRQLFHDHRAGPLPLMLRLDRDLTLRPLRDHRQSGPSCDGRPKGQRLYAYE